MSSAPARRRPKGPLHPPYRGAPTSGISMSGPQARHGSGAVPSSPTEGTDLGLGFLSQQPVTPSRKRNWTPSIQSVSEPYAGQSGWSSSHAPSSSSFGAVAGGVADDPVYAQHAARGYDRDTLTSSFESSSRAWETLNRAQEASQAAQARERQQKLAIASHVQEEPATKKRKGVAGTIVEGAVNTALYAGAAAITAYSLWSSWGRRPSMTEQASAQGQAVSPPTPSKTTLPGGLPDYFPPPPYAEAPISPSASSVGSSIAPNARRAQNVYISRRRRRPVFQSYRNVIVARQMEDGLQTPSTSATSITAPSDIMEAGSSDMDADDDDDEFSRLNKRMAAMIAEGQAALTAGPEAETDEDGLQQSTVSYLASATAPSRIPQSTSTISRPSAIRPSTLQSMRSPSQIDFSFAAKGSGGTPSNNTRFSSPALATPSRLDSMQSKGASPFVFGASSNDSKALQSPNSPYSRPAAGRAGGRRTALGTANLSRAQHDVPWRPA